MPFLSARFLACIAYALCLKCLCLDAFCLVSVADVQTQLFFAPDRMWLPRGEESSAAQHGATNSGTRERAVEIQGSIVVEPHGLGAGNRGEKEEPTAIETSERPTSLFFAPDHMWMPADRRMQHEQLQQRQSAAEAQCVPAPVPVIEQEHTPKGIISPGIEALRQAAEELSAAAAAAIKEASISEPSVESFVTAENPSDDENQGEREITENDSVDTFSEIERNGDEVPVGIGPDEARDEIRKSAWEGMSAFDHDVEEASPEPRSRKATPPRVRFFSESLEGCQIQSASISQHIRSAVKRATDALTDEKEEGGDNDTEDVELGSSKFEAGRRVHGKHEAPHQQTACLSNISTGHDGVVSSITVPEWARGVANKYFQRRAEAQARAQQKALRLQEVCMCGSGRRVGGRVGKHANCALFWSRLDADLKGVWQKLETLEAHPPEHSHVSNRATKTMLSGSGTSMRSPRPAPPLSQSPLATTLYPGLWRCKQRSEGSTRAFPCCCAKSHSVSSPSCTVAYDNTSREPS
jgi:hypothetical protein